MAIYELQPEPNQYEFLQSEQELEVQGLLAIAADSLYRVVSSNRNLLEARQLDGELRIFGESSVGAIENAREQRFRHAVKPTAERFYIRSQEGRFVGSAVVGNQRLTRTRTRFPLVQRSESEVFPYASPNIFAWTAEKEMEDGTLNLIYQSLVKRFAGSVSTDNSPKAWAIEPESSPTAIHEAIAQNTELTFINSNSYRNPNQFNQTPDRTKLYARLHSQWLTKHGRLKELKANEVSTFTAEGKNSAQTIIDTAPETR